MPPPVARFVQVAVALNASGANALVIALDSEGGVWWRWQYPDPNAPTQPWVQYPNGRAPAAAIPPP